MQMNGWEPFFGAVVAASAALTGLLFVGISINLRTILSLPNLPNLTLEPLVVLLAVVLVSLLPLAPGESPRLIGAEVLAVAGMGWAALTFVERRRWGTLEARYRRNYIPWIFLGQFAMLAFIAAGGTLLAGQGGGLYWTVPAIVCSFVHAVGIAWVLLVEINR